MIGCTRGTRMNTESGMEAMTVKLDFSVQQRQGRNKPKCKVTDV